MSMRLPDLARWPLPPMEGARSADTVAVLAPVAHTWPLMPIQLQWLQECATKYGFADVDEALRHLIYLANSEPSTNKRLIFRIKRCLHCHVGARASQHAKVDLVAQVHAFQMQWLRNVTEKCDIKSLEKSVRIICDYYQSRVKQAEQEGGGKGFVKERELFSVRREEDPRLAKALAAAAVAAENTSPNDCAGASASPNDTGRNGGTMGCDLKGLAEDPATCSEEATLEAIRRCQVGRGSSSYAQARGENREETEKRRQEELKVEQSEEAKKERELIGKALGSVMG